MDGEGRALPPVSGTDLDRHRRSKEEPLRRGSKEKWEGEDKRGQAEVEPSQVHVEHLSVSDPEGPEEGVGSEGDISLLNEIPATQGKKPRMANS